MIETCLIIITILFIISLFGRNARVRDDLEKFMRTMTDYMRFIHRLNDDVQNIKKQLNELHSQFSLKNIDIHFPAMHKTPPSKKKPKLEVVTKKGEKDEDTEKDR
tara:strand:- start:505 stop:819 length:315 start_codon:yes stop_codon:yes gene_type:complete